jgi:hypothetical protein
MGYVIKGTLKDSISETGLSGYLIEALAFRIAESCTNDEIHNPKYLPVEVFKVNNEIRYIAQVVERIYFSERARCFIDTRCLS